MLRVSFSATLLSTHWRSSLTHNGLPGIRAEQYSSIVYFMQRVSGGFTEKMITNNVATGPLGERRQGGHLLDPGFEHGCGRAEEDQEQGPARTGLLELSSDRASGNLT